MITKLSFLRGFCSGATILVLLGCWKSSASVLINEIMFHPSSEDIREEYIELFNSGPTNVNLSGWRFSSGVQFTFPSVMLAAGGHLVVAADVTRFSIKYPGVANVIGNWSGRLSNSRNTIDLDDAASNRVDSVAYADEGDWAVRRRTPPDHSHTGWSWYAEADGLGKSLELINPSLANEHGQNWAASIAINGTPGSANGVLQTNIAPLILNVQHLPPIPRSLDDVLITARLLDERTSNVTATLFWRLDEPTALFTSQPMYDDGLHSDGIAGDGVYGATIPAQLNNAIVEFYVEGTDQESHTRTWPAAAINTNGASLGQAANMLYQVDDSTYAGAFPLYKLIMKDANRAELAQIGSGGIPGEADSDAEMNGTFISVDGTGTDVRYVTSIRNRGHGSRNRKPNNYRVGFTTDRTWKGVSALNINGQYTHAQLIGSVLALKSGLIAAESRPVQVRVNNANLANNGPQTYGGVYVANEVINTDWAEHWLPADSSGNVYRVIRDIDPPNFNYRGTNANSYTNTYFKETNASENDWTDLIAMLEVMGENRTNLYTIERARAVVNVEQWMLHMAVMSLFANGESGLNTGNNDDYYMYRGVNDPRFVLLPYDLDQILGEGSSLTTNSSIFRGATCCPISGDSEGTWRAMNWFMHRPDVEVIYLRTLQQLLETTFAKPEFDLTIDQTLADFVPASVISRIKTWMNGRRAHVENAIAPFVATNGIPSVATISGEPRSPTPLRNAMLTVGGSGATQYRYSLNGGAFGTINSVATPIQLANLPHGSTNTVRVIAAGTNGLWQSVSDATVSKTWVVNTNWPAIRINEVLARNVAALNHNGTFPDTIELYNEGSGTVDLSNLRLTDNAGSPSKYTFPVGTTLASNNYLVVYANNSDGTPGIHTGFNLNQDGEGVFLFDRAANGGALLDSVQFGLQLPDRSIGRISGGGEFVLTQPSFGANNVAQPPGDPHSLRINEWLASEFVTATTDFVELYNTEAQPVAIGGLYFTDNPIGEPTKHTIAPLSFIDANGYRVFKADGDPQQGFDHLDLKLAAEQGLIALLMPDLETIDLVLYGPQRTDISQGRAPDGGNSIVFFDTPTPGAANSGISACTVTVSNFTLMTLTNVWKYNQTSNLDGVNWRAPNYNDSGWPSGSGLLAFENNSAITPLIRTTLADPRIPPAGLISGHAYYFRTILNLSNSLSGYTISATAYIDDGAVLYVNGNEITPRIRMDPGVVTNNTPAPAQPSGGDATSPDTFNISGSMFVGGTNVIAVEVHQNGTNSSDIVWGMALDAIILTTNCAQRTVVLNEVLANNQSFTNAAGRTPDWVELVNTSTTNIDLGDMSLTDDVGQPRKWVFPTSTVLTPGGRVVIDCDDSLLPSSTNTGFALSADGDAVFLFKRLSDGGGMLDSIAFGLQPNDYSIGRIPDVSGGWALALPTRAAANVPATLGNASSLKINEWLASPSTGDDWLELFNPNLQPVELGGLTISDNPLSPDKSRFLPLSFIGPQGYQKLVADGSSGNAASHVGFSLNSATGFIGLYWPIGTQIDAISYGQQSADVSQGRFPDGTTNFTSFSETVSPGQANYLLLTNLVINELLSHTDPPLEDAVEIRNLSSDPVDISGWYLSNTGESLRKFLVPANTVVTSGGFRVFYEYQFGTNTSPGALSPFNFNSAHGDEVHLSQTVAGNLTGYRARARFGAATNGVSFGRFLTSVGEEFVAMTSRSFGVDNPTTLAQFRGGAGAPNPLPRVGPVVFSEINYFPTNRYDTNIAGSGEFLELLNITSNTVPLYDPAAATNTWRISGGVEFSFPANATLAGRASLLIVNFDPVADTVQSNWFRTTYQVPATVRIYGPYSGALANEGNNLELLRPDPPQLPPNPDAGFVPYVLVERVHYLPTVPWPTNGVGAGLSLQRTVPSSFGNEPLNWFTARATASFNSTTDTDGDSLPDYWEIEHGLNPNSSVGANGAIGDLDGDVQNNRQEFLAGSRPDDETDYLHIESAVIASNNVIIGFHAAGGHTYSILYSDLSPIGPWSKLADAPASANPAFVLITSPTASSRARFYRLVAPALASP